MQCLKRCRLQFIFTIPAGCRQATMISQVSHYSDEEEVLIVPYRCVRRDCPRFLATCVSQKALCCSAILVTGIAFDKGSGMTVVSADVLPDSYDRPEDLPTIIV